MDTELLNRSLIESEFETLVTKSKDYMNSRNEDELVSLRNDLVQLRLKLEKAIEDNNGHSASYMIALKLMLSIIHKFTFSVELMENLKSKTPICHEFDTQQMLDILLPHLKSLVEYDNWCEKLDLKKLEEDYAFIESLEDQHKRVLLTYLIQDWHNIDEIINLLKIGEIYKNIAEKLVSLSLVSTYLNNK